jgi:hypothetical protein
MKLATIARLTVKNPGALLSPILHRIPDIMTIADNAHVAVTVLNPSRGAR